MTENQTSLNQTIEKVFPVYTIELSEKASVTASSQAALMLLIQEEEKSTGCFLED